MAVTFGPLPGALRRYDPAARRLDLSDSLPRQSRGFQLAFQLVLMEGARRGGGGGGRGRALHAGSRAMMLRIGLLNYLAAAVLMPYDAFLAAVRELRHDMEARRRPASASPSSRPAIGFPPCSGKARAGVPFFFLRVDPAGNVGKRFSAAGFPFARFGGSCPKWIVHQAFATPGQVRVQLAQLPDGGTFLCFARTVRGPAARWGEPAPVHVVAMGCDISRAPEVVYGDGLDLEKAMVGIGLSCRLCDRLDCRSRAFPPLEHRLALDPMVGSASPYRFEPPKGR